MLKGFLLSASYSFVSMQCLRRFGFLLVCDDGNVAFIFLSSTAEGLQQLREDGDLGDPQMSSAAPGMYEVVFNINVTASNTLTCSKGSSMNVHLVLWSTVKR